MVQLYYGTSCAVKVAVVASRPVPRKMSISRWEELVSLPLPLETEKRSGSPEIDLERELRDMLD